LKVNKNIETKIVKISFIYLKSKTNEGIVD